MKGKCSSTSNSLSPGVYTVAIMLHLVAAAAAVFTREATRSFYGASKLGIELRIVWRNDCSSFGA